MPKRKTQDGDDLDGDQSAPLPIQSFFWRQTSPFIRPKLGNLCEASCVSFERVVVQNILHGLSPSLCEALQSVSRWKVVQAAFPHVIHACAALLMNRKQTNPDAKFGNSETKLLYTLHWIILDAASECEDHDEQKASSKVYTHSLSTIQLFVYLFAPLVHTLHESDFQPLKLESGLRIWQALLDYQQPDVPCFSVPVKPQRNILKAQRNHTKSYSNAANIYIGKGTSTENMFLGFDLTGGNSRNEPASPLAPLAHMSDICGLSNSDSQSATVEVVCEYCNSVVPVRPSDGSSACRCGRKDSAVTFSFDSKASIMPKLSTSQIDKDYLNQKLASAITSGPKGPLTPDILSASYFDVAVLRCLFCMHWPEDGIYWALRYIHQRLLEISDEIIRQEHVVRERSKSLPVPDIQVLRSQSIPPSPVIRLDESHLLGRKSPVLQPPITPSAPSIRKEPPFKRIRVIELKQFFDTGKSFLKKKESLEAEDSEAQSPKTLKADFSYLSTKSLKEDSSSSCTLSTLDTDTELTRPCSALGNYLDVDKSGKSDDMFSDIRRKSMPSLHDKEESNHSSQVASCSTRVDSMPVGLNLKQDLLMHPIITITEHSPDAHAPAASFFDSSRKRGSIESDVQSQVSSIGLSLNMSRSMTDSNIAYSDDDNSPEASGSVHYIQQNGQINYKVILKAVHFVAMNEHSARVSEVLLNILNCLLDFDIIEVKKSNLKSKPVSSPVDKKDDCEDGGIQAKKEPDNKQGNSTSHSISMDSIIRIYKALGCPNGCVDGFRGAQGDHLRLKGQNCFQRLQRMNPVLFRKYLRDSVKKHSVQDTVDFLHAFLGFCIETGTSPQSPQGSRKASSVESNSRGFVNNFGHSIGGVGYRGVEGVLVANILKPFVSKCVDCAKELSSHENISLFCDIRQLISYMKEVHGGTLRRVALSGLLDSLERLRKNKAQEREKKQEEKKKGIPLSVKRTTSCTSDSGDEKDWQKTPSVSNHDDSAGATVKSSRRSIFRKKVKKPLVLPYSAASDSEVLEENFHGKLASRVSMSASEDDPPSGANTPKRRFSRFQIGWRRQVKSDHEDELPNDPPTLDRRDSRSETHFHRTKGKMSFRAASHATLTFLSARKRIEDGLRTLGRRMSRRGSIDDSRVTGTTDVSESLGTEVLVVREKKLVDHYIIKSGMLRFSFLLECCHPGSLPDPQLVAAMLDLDAPVVARASLLLECAHFIHRCNHGDWPNWMKLNLPTFRHSAGALHNRGQPSGYRRGLIVQRAAGRMFYAWAENLGSQLEYILAKEHTDRLAIIDEIKDEIRRRELRSEDDKEDFLDEATVNFTGSDCPYALKMVACLVLLEITTFLRETFQYLPKSRTGKREPGLERTTSIRRLSGGVGSPGHSEKSSESNIAELPQTQATVGSPTERKISFAVHAERSDSIHSSTTSLPVIEGPEEKKGRRLAQGRQKLLKHFRRGSGHNSSFRHNRSFRLKRQEGGSIKRFGSIRSRKISNQSVRSDDKILDEDHTEDTESPNVISDENPESSADHQEADDENLCQNMPWIRTVVQLANLSNFICIHHNYCHPHCYERQRRSCSRLITAVKKIYEATSDNESSKEMEKKPEMKKDHLKEKLKRRESIFQQSSPTRRRESTPLLEKIKSDVTLTKIKMGTNWRKEDKPKEMKEPPPIVRYITSQAQNLTQCPMAIVTKAAPVLSESIFVDMMPVAWELILENDQELAASAATVFLLSSVKAPEKSQNMVIKELQHENTNQRINAVLRFGSLWQFRYQVWPRMEEGANMLFKVPPPSIDFTLPSPTIGLPSQSVVDPPWMPHFKAKIEEVTLNQEETKTLVTATTTRRKQQQEMIHRALKAEDERKRIGRENFPLTTVPVAHLAAYEPALHHASEEHEEAMQEEINLAARRVSLAPVNRANIQSRSMSWRNGSLHWGRLTLEGDEDRTEHVHHMQMVPSFFPSSICVAILPILHLLDDYDVNIDGVSVSEIAGKVIWTCLVEDPALFLRHFLEKLTHKDRQEELLFLLRKLLLHYRDLPAQMAHSLFNYLIGYVMFYVRTPSEGGQEAIGAALAVLWQVVPSVEGIYFKDLKQTLRKEQCDPFLLVSSNVPSAKKIIVHGPDLASIPSQLPIHEDTKFSQVLQDCLDFFNIPEDQHDSYYLVDTKSTHMHNLNSFVRDFYFFRRNIYPQLSLVYMNPDAAYHSLQKQAFILKFVEIGKVMFTNVVLNSTPLHQVQNHVSFLHEEFMKLPTFPRKSLEAEFSLYRGQWGKELYGLDTLHKYAWVKLMATMFTSMSNNFTWSSDLPLFLNVINGTIVLHCEDSAVLRHCLAVLINTCKHFKHIFATSGFLHIMPTLLRVYSNNKPNTVLCKAVLFVCRQFYILHRKPFILQMFGSLAPLLDMDVSMTNVIDCSKIQPDYFFKLLLSVGQDCPDNLDVLDLVDGDKPLKALDFCYENDSGTFDMVDIINMCVTVIAYAPDSFRSNQMLVILEVVVPKYLQHLKKETIKKDSPSAARAEIQAISNIAISIRALISACESFTRNMSIPQRHLESVNTNIKPLQNHVSYSAPSTTYYYEDKEESHGSRHGEDGRKKQYVPDLEDMEMKQEYCKPRDSLLFISSEFFTSCHYRLRELRKVLADPTFRPQELYDFKTHNRLAEIAHTLLKLAPYDPYSMGCSGLQCYMVQVLPVTDWSQEQVRPALNLILRRLERLFCKISKKQVLRRKVDWEAAANMLKGVYLTLRRFNFIAHLTHLKTLIGVLLGLILSSTYTSTTQPDIPLNIHGSHKSDQSQGITPVPPLFSSAVVKLVAMQMQALGDQFSLEQICGGMSVFTSVERCLNMLVDFILPLCIRIGCGRRDTPRLRQADISFALTMVLNALSPPAKLPSQQNSKQQHVSNTDQGQASSTSQVDKYTLKQGTELLQQTAYLGLEILMVCFDKALAPEWHRVAKCLMDFGAKSRGSLSLWKFLDFLVTYRPSIFLLLQPFIQFKMMKVNCDTAQEYFLQQTIKDKLLGLHNIIHPRCKSSVLIQLTVELRQVKEELVNADFHPVSGAMLMDQSDVSQIYIPDNLQQITLNEITAEIVPPKPFLGSIGKRPSRSTVFSQSSSSSSTPFKTTAMTSSVDSGSPLLNRIKSGKRISARDGSRILEKFTRKNTITGDVSPEPQTPGSPKLKRQPTIYFHSVIAKQANMDVAQLPAGIMFENEYSEGLNGAVGTASHDEDYVEGNEQDPRTHRLQRQDAKSRKTFKIKRQKTKTTSMRMRFMSRRGHHDHGEVELVATEGSPTHGPLSSAFGPDAHTLQLRRAGVGASIARSVETIPEAVEVKPRRRQRYIQRSKSHDDPSADVHVPSGTARSRIARQGARIIRSRSPSSSPVHYRSAHVSPASSQTYVARCDSSDSINVNENSALLKEDEKNKSLMALCIYFDGNELDDSMV